MNNHIYSYLNAGNMASYANMYNTYMLDKKTGDVNGDRIYDTVYLVGEKRENPFYENLRVMVQDGRTMQWHTIPLYPNYSMSYSPWLFLGDFTGSNADEIMVSMPVGGSGALTYYYVISFQNNIAKIILGPETFVKLTENLNIEVVYKDDYKVVVKSDKLNQSYILDVSDRKESYEGTVYDKNGKLIKPRNGFVVYQPHLNPVKFDGSEPYRLEASQDIAGTSHADRLGYIITYWKYTGHKRSWVLDPEMFTVML